MQSQVRSTLSFLTLIPILILTAACAGNTSAGISAVEATADKQEAPKVFGISVRDAEASDCAAGGTVIEVYLDANVSGALEEGESIVSAKAVCNGQNGQNGSNGQDGANGQNGQDGANGADAVLPAFTIVDAIFPCGNNSNYKEVLLRLQNGQILTSFSDNTQGNMTRLVLLPDGIYMNSDNTNCVFSLSTQGQTRSISWSGQVQKSWSVVP